MNRVSLKNWFLIGCLAVVGLGSCTAPGEALTDRKKRENDAEIAQYIATNNLTGKAQTTDNGTWYVITTSNPTGQTAGTGDEIKYHYIARRFDGLIDDSTDLAPNLPRMFTRGYYDGNVITAGIYDGIVNSGAVKTGLERVGLRKGERATLLVPSYLDAGRVGTLLLPQYSPVQYDVTVVNVRTEEQQIQDYLKAAKITPTFSETNGLRVTVTQARPDSVQITTGKTVTATYKGYFTNGKVFDSGSQPISAQIGANSVVPGFDQGLTKLRQGEKATIIFPSALGYGIAGSRNNNGAYTVPPYSPLIFDVTITSVK
ncbi:MAG: FKBP-type peptidyl-prolyl cis-trans isomerase [Rudanella sp.]|nr:FKBP-type peptidyl-prolyl cis-trans isomerase [Rudanella sp.]